MVKYGMITCDLCGVEFYGATNGRKYCDNCRKAIAGERKKNAREKYRIEKEKTSKQTRLNTVCEVTRLADAEGLSYGKYCLKYGI